MKIPNFLQALLLILAIIPMNAFADAYDPTNDLFFAFGSKCKGKGPVNNAALNDGAGIKYIIEKIRDENACKGIFGALSDIETLNIPQLLKERVAENDLEYMSMQSNDLELAIAAESKATTPDAAYITDLKKELIQTKVNIAKSKKLSNQEKTRTRLETIDNFQKYSNVLFSRLKQSDQCLTKNPNLSAQIGAQVLGLGSTLASGLVGSLLLATGNMIDNFVSFFKEKSLGAKIKGIVNNRLGEAIGCSFEGLGYTYCQARDVETVINFNKNKSEGPTSNPSWLDGIGIIGQDVQSFNDWVTQIDAGSPAGTTGRAADKKSALSQKNDLSLVRIDLEGILSTAKRTLAKSANKVNATRKALNDLAAKMTPTINYSNSGSSTQTGPLLNSFPSDPQCGPYIYLYSKGVDRERKDTSSNGSCAAVANNLYPNPPDINTEVGPLIVSLLSEASQDVNIQISQVNESNPNLVLSKVDTKSQNRRSAREFLNSSVAYLDNLLKDPNSIAKKKIQKDLIEKTKSQIINSLAIIERTQEPVDPAAPKGPKQPADPTKKIADLSAELIPQGDTFAVPKALSEIINQDIDQKMSLGQIDENLAALMQLSSNDSLGELIKYFIGLEAAKTQARSAKELSKSNLTAIGSLFSENLESRMEKLSKDSKEDSDANESLALLCMQSLAVPDSPKVGDTDVLKYCSGKSYQSIYNNSGIKMDYNEISKKPYPEKACAVYDFYRKSYLYGLKSNRGTVPALNSTRSAK
ncbi:MAG: hypothetical protein H7061_13480 [Bdellovibrionaceae bacterium]|nr:hypothetical protein [Bdellovibrio sp.]